jgi:15-cis-phytoene synthase
MDHTVTRASMSADRESVRVAARSYAFDRYLAALLAPRATRDDLLAVAAYSGEVARIPLTVSEASLAEIRLQWWRDSLEAGSLGGAKSGSPVADAVVRLLEKTGLPVEVLLSVTEGRSRELYEDGIEDEAAFESYFEETEGAVFQIGARVLGGGDDTRLDHLVSCAARSVGRAQLALALPAYLANGLLPLPIPLLELGDPRGLPEEEAHRAAAFITQRLVREARHWHQAAALALATVPKAVRGAFLPLSLVEPYCRALERQGHDSLLEVAEISPLSRVTRLWFASMRGPV